jgi:type II restriction enzyme
MKFDVVVGNPPYQESGAARDEPVYHYFYDLAGKASHTYCLISPARFLFNAGQTPKSWNTKMLDDKHLKVMFYEQNSADVFANTDIKGGVAIVYRDDKQVYGSMGIFTHYDELNSIVEKTAKVSDMDFSTIVQPQGIYRFSERFFADFPQAEELQGKGTKSKIVSKSFSQMDFAFHIENTAPDEISMLGLVGGKREYKWISSKYLVLPESFDKWRVIIAETNNTGVLGEILSNPLIGNPNIAHTDTFLTVGAFDTEAEANAVLKYIKTKFARVLLGVLKITQHNSRSTWSKVPLQDFTPNSDIDWTKSIPEIDQQLYAKYGLDENEIAFIEKKVKAME